MAQLRPVLLTGALAGVGLGLALAACSAKPPPDPRLEAPLVETVSPGPVGGADPSYTGVVSARVQSDIGFRVAGMVTKRLVEVGQTVHRGQPLMRIDPRDLQLTLAGLKAKADQAVADEARDRDLVAAGAISASNYDQVRANAEAAVAQMKVAQNEAGYAVIAADADGVVVQTLAEPGQVVAAGQTVIKLAHAGPREASVNLPEIMRPALGSTAAAAVFGQPGGAQARLRQLSDAADPITRTFEARYVLDGSAAQAPIGATVTISLQGPASSGGVEVPIGAVVDAGHGPGVFIVDRSSMIHLRPVKIAALGAETVTVTGDIPAFATIVAAGVSVLHDGEKVRLSSWKVAAQ